MGPESRPNIVWLLTALVLSGALAAEPPASRPSEQGVVAGGVAILKRADAVDLAQPIPVSLSSLEGVKLAFQTKGSANACFTLHDEAAKKDLRPARGVWKLTGNCPHVPGCRWGGGGWVPCLYRMDLFGQDSMIWHKMGKPPEGSFTRLDFARLSSPKETLQVRDLVLYRGDDGVAPEAPAGLAAQAGDEGVRLSWQPARDDVGAAWYVLSRASGDGKFTKIAQTDEVPHAGAMRTIRNPERQERMKGSTRCAGSASTAPVAQTSHPVRSAAFRPCLAPPARPTTG
jgi:hypothetical protein